MSSSQRAQRSDTVFEYSYKCTMHSRLTRRASAVSAAVDCRCVRRRHLCGRLVYGSGSDRIAAPRERPFSVGVSQWTSDERERCRRLVRRSLAHMLAAAQRAAAGRRVPAARR